MPERPEVFLRYCDSKQNCRGGGVVWEGSDGLAVVVNQREAALLIV